MKFNIKYLFALSLLFVVSSLFADSARFVLPSSSQAESLFQKVQNEIFPQLSADKKDFYNTFLRQVQYNTSNLPDVSEPTTMKAYLAFYKLNKYFPNEIPVRFDVLDETSPLLGYSSKEFRELKNMPSYKAMLWLEKVLYNTKRFKMLPLSLREEASQEAEKLLYNILRNRFKLSSKEISSQLENFLADEKLVEMGFTNRFQIHDVDNEFNNWCIEIILSPKGVLSSTEFMPFGLVALHELLHAQDIFPGEKENYHLPLMELATSLQDIMLSDLVYKKIKNISLEKVVSYSTGSLVPEGEVAVFLHKLQKRYPNKNMTQLLTLPDFQEYIENLYKKYSGEDKNNMRDQTESALHQKLQLSYPSKNNPITSKKFSAYPEKVQILNDRQPDFPRS